MTLLKILSWIVFTVLIGNSIISFIVRNGTQLYASERLALSYALGIGLVSLEMVVLSWLGIPFSIVSIGLFWCAVIAVSFLSLGMERVVGDYRVWKEFPARPSVSQYFLIAGTVLQMATVFFLTFRKPLEAWDAVALYGTKAKIFFMEGGIPADYIARFQDSILRMEIPLLGPLSETYFYVFWGGLEDRMVKIMFPLFYVAILVLVYCTIKRSCQTSTALLFTFMLATVNQFADQATNGYMDILIAYYYPASIIYLYCWMKNRNTGYLFLSGMLAAMTLWTKPNGLLLITVNCILLFGHIVESRFKNYKPQILYVSTMAMLLFIYQWIIDALALKYSHEAFKNVNLFNASAHFIQKLDRIPAILYEYQMQFFQPKRWNLIWILFFALWITNIRKCFKEEEKYLSLCVVLTIVGYTVTYLLTTMPVTWVLSTTVSRVFLHFLPVCILLMALSYKELGFESFGDTYRNPTR